MKMTLMCMTLGMLAGCGSVVSTGNAPSKPAGADTCNAAAYAELVGQDAVQSLALPDPKRSYRLDEPVTMDFVAERLNIKLDETDTIIAIDCG
jgi:hypothetical protein